MPKHLREIKKERLVELYIDEKLSINQIAKIERLSPASILKLMRDYNIERRSISEAKRIRESK